MDDLACSLWVTRLCKKWEGGREGRKRWKAKQGREREKEGRKRRRDEDILSHLEPSSSHCISLIAPAVISVWGVSPNNVSVTLFKSVAHLKVDARGPLVSRLVPGFPARLLNSGKIRCSFEELLSRRKTFEGTCPPWASWLLCLAILKGYFQLGLSKGNGR